MSGQVMIVDDDPSIVEVVSYALKRAGFTVTAAGDGNGCLELLRGGYKGVILMDITMPDLDGWETIDRIVTEGLLDGNAICMLTGKTEPEARGTKLEAYIVDYLAKPFSTGDLVAMVKAAQSHLAP